MGYSGGTTGNPTYEDLGDHTETIQIEYDPSQISYEKLLDIFWESHDPAVPSWPRQYMSIIFYHNDVQKRLALESRDRLEARLKIKIYTEIVPAPEFYPTEDYHQKYYLRLQPELIKDFRAMYPDTDDFINSTAAARINGYVGGHGTLATLEKEIDSFGLSPAASKALTEIVRTLEPEAACPVPD